MMELRELRDSAKGLLHADIAFLTGEAGGQALAPRLIANASEKAREFADEGTQYASDHKFRIGVGLAVAAGALAAWVFRDRIAHTIDQVLDHITGDEMPDTPDDAAAEQHDQDMATAPTE